MPQVTIRIGETPNKEYFFKMTTKKAGSLIKFANSIINTPASETELFNEIRTGLQQVKQIRNGDIPRKSLNQLLNEK